MRREILEKVFAGWHASDLGDEKCWQRRPRRRDYKHASQQHGNAAAPVQPNS
jgi:hypothetical protein